MPSLKEITQTPTRREFLEWMGAITALLATPACFRQPLEKIVPYSKMPEDLIPGEPLYYATSMPLRGYGAGLLVESHMGRPTKIEGNAWHPASTGASTVEAQASILSLYDPDRSKALTRNGVIAPWESFSQSARRQLQLARAAGQPVRVLSPPLRSATQLRLARHFLSENPNARWCEYEPCGTFNAGEGMRLLYGEAYAARWDFNRADRVVSFDADFLAEGPASTRYARDFMKKRSRENREGFSRLYAIESNFSLTGAMADHRLAVRPSEMKQIAMALASRLRGEKVSGSGADWETWVTALAEDLRAHQGRALFIAGDSQPPEVHAVVQLMNEDFGNVGKTVFLIDEDRLEKNRTLSLESLVNDMAGGNVAAVFLLGANPAYFCPAGLKFNEALARVPMRVHLGLYADETAALCQWHIPQTHYLEQWGDLRAWEGTASLTQPLIRPLYQSKSLIEVLALLSGEPGKSDRELVRDTWKNKGKAGLSSVGFEQEWRRWLHNGFIPNTAAKDVRPAIRRRAVSVRTAPEKAAKEALELSFRADPYLWDTDSGNNGWLLELPRPLTQVTWDNAALLSPATAEKYQIKSGDVIEIHSGGQTLEAPACKLTGFPDHTIGLSFGFGRTRAGRLATGVGYNAYRLRPNPTAYSQTGAQVKKTGRHVRLACTQDHQSMEGRDLLREVSLSALGRNRFPWKESHGEKRPITIPVDPESFPPPGEAEYQWGMSIDLNACTGCHACVVACQSENNIPIVGKEQVLNGREMHWLRIDHYIDPKEEGRFRFQPVLCMHCETAPCEVVCPVAATAHSHEGLNQMVYNRCVGTRYCSNNCPYKVRRFNFYDYTDPTPQIRMLQNPDVTVRARGVMEKCTYCVQRIQAAKLDSAKENRRVKDGEVQTACQQACATNAIVFGDIKDKTTAVSKKKASALDYGLLADLNTRPRTTYLPRVRNTNPKMKGENA